MIRAARREAENLLDRSRQGLSKKVEPSGHYGAVLRCFLIGLYTSGLMSNRILVVLCWHITNAGAVGVNDLGSDPATLHRNASRVLSDALGLQTIAQNCLMEFVLPMRSNVLRKTQNGTIWMVPFFEVFALQFQRNRAEFMKHLAQPGLLCNNFYEHALVKTHGASRCFPVRLFFDYGRLDNKVSTLNVFVSCPHIGKRIPVVSVHGPTICRCGCRGAHTVQPIFDIIAWMFRVMARGRRPARDYCRKAWPADSRRAAVANTELFNGHIGVLDEVSGDLDEYPKTTGLPDYRSNCGCLRCFKNKRSADWTDPTKRAPCRKHKWLVDSARSSLAFHSVDTEAMAQVRGACRGKKKKGGQIITKAVPLVPGLRRGDRIEPACGTPEYFFGFPATPGARSQV